MIERLMQIRLSDLKMSEIVSKIKEVTGVSKVHWFLVDAVLEGSKDDILRAIERERKR
ncbi:MAG: hypothetical protein K6G73_12580 [Marinilabiliaceae bacterium]|nr:hypothetical protein [Marinilabiliaceae bacterium]